MKTVHLCLLCLALSGPLCVMGQNKVMTRAEAAATGIYDSVLKVSYPAAFEYGGEDQSITGIVHGQEELNAYVKVWTEFLQGIGQADFHFGKPYRGHCVVYFAADGTVDYFLYSFRGGAPSEELQQKFDALMEKYVSSYVFGIKADRKFSQCGGLSFE